MISTIIIDDEQHNIQLLKGLLCKYCNQLKIVAEATTLIQAQELILTHHPQLLFLDIQIGKRTSFELLQQLPHRNFEIIFVTAYDYYGIQAVKFAALDYILKPIDTTELVAAVNKAVLNIHQKKQTEQLKFLVENLNYARPFKIALPQQSGTLYIEIDNIIYCESSNTYTYFYTEKYSKIVVSKSLKEYEEMLTPQGFLRCHQSFLVNKKYVKQWLNEDGGQLLLHNGLRIPVSRLKKDYIKQALV